MQKTIELNVREQLFVLYVAMNYANDSYYDTFDPEYKFIQGILKGKNTITEEEIGAVENHHIQANTERDVFINMLEYFLLKGDLLDVIDKRFAYVFTRKFFPEQTKLIKKLEDWHLEAYGKIEPSEEYVKCFY